ncbi:thiaminase II [Mycobacterium sp. 1274756.6]|uniref:thiaminase II n=1 Tax=Mycobacterium sp. 1274756.6 TaxID=1834076 RepID=UPI0007FBC146|nr:thiaminase II [Mycobacterium sp. 1274756.6]OBJ71394.1 thiaminase II [Mycobacterium sp. 1274756.6]
MASRTRDLLWADAAEIYRGICAHPFISGLTDGSLERERFRHYIVQDAHYLRGYAKALAVCAAKAPDEAELMMFAEHAGQAVAAEREMHAELLDGLGLDAERAAALPIAPTTQAYVSYLLAVTYSGSYAEAVAAVLPCYWIYARVGEHLQAGGSTDALYRRWIDAYAEAEFQAVVEAALTVTDRIGARAAEDELAAMRRHFHTTARYEWMFWDGAYRMEQWPV